MFTELINFDTKSLIGVLVWGNVATGIIICLYRILDNHKIHNRIFLNMIVIRFLSAIGYLLLFFRYEVIDIVSVNIGNTLLFACHYMEAMLILRIVNVVNKRINKVIAVILVVDALAFNIMELYFRDASLRVSLASVIIFSVFLIPTIYLLTAKNVSRFKKGISIFYLFLLIALIPRGIEAYLDKNFNVLSNNYFQTLLFMALILMMISNTIVYLLFLKEQADTIIKKMATLDSLTNALNRHSFLIQGKEAFDKHKSQKTGLALLFFDLDHYKNANDNYGHIFGDEVLIRFTDIIKSNIRPNDLCCRYGGDEFIVLLMNASENVSNAIASQIMRDTERYSFESHPNFHITTSVGNVQGVPKVGDLLGDYIQKGDEALYQAKKMGRNKMVAYNKEVK